ncbi:MAG: SH3 domain-containing protein [Bacteroidales bacterium]|nr:SH3 domain-containing protein [Bacteroidales bacterium]
MLASCTKPNQYFAKERYIVTTNTLNIRIDPTQLSKNIGTLKKGDIITALASDKYWVMVKVGDQTGFVSIEYVKKIDPISAPKIVSFIERNADWVKWPFWVISILLITIWIISELGLMRYENRLKIKFGINAKKISVSPLIFFVTGILTAILYLYWKDQIIESLFNRFSFLPRGMGSIAWIIWILYLTLLLGMIVDFSGSIYRSGIKFGPLTFLMELGINLIIFLTTFFLVISLFLIAIIFLIVFFAVLYTIVVTENSKSFSGFIGAKK